jgi:SRSO17 transposase
MTKRLLCPPAPGPLEAYAERFDDCLGTVAQRRGFREYLQGLLLPRDRHKTLTGLVGTEPVDGAQAPSAQRLQFFLSESTWDAEAITRRRLELVRGAGDRRQRDRRRHQPLGRGADLLPAASWR